MIHLIFILATLLIGMAIGYRLRQQDEHTDIMKRLEIAEKKTEIIGSRLYNEKQKRELKNK